MSNRAPLRKIVDRKHDKDGHLRNVFECGHMGCIALGMDAGDIGCRRACYTCQIEQAIEKLKGAPLFVKELLTECCEILDGDKDLRYLMSNDFSLNDEQTNAYRELIVTYKVNPEEVDYLEPEQMTELLATIKALRAENGKAVEN